MSVKVLAFRDEFFPARIDACLWRQISRSFNVKTTFINCGVETIDPTNVVVFDETGSIPLTEFKHPENATYIFGATGMDMIQQYFPSAPCVRIEVSALVSKQGLFGPQAAAIVLYDREAKLWR